MKIRHLSKIIFIKSADIDYEEIVLDGNVHFIGDQGVGKSTVLRAILFLYNARTDRLGIKSGDERFLDFYFKYDNSHIIYEIQTEHTVFCVWLTKEGNRPAYRFIDTPYNKGFFIEKTNRASRSLKVEEVKERLNEKGIFRSKKIFQYNEFRDIFYGASSNNKFKVYSLMESSSYQNVPNTITNIFLNAQLHSDKIKQTIISSLIEDEENHTSKKYQIDLEIIRKDLSEFEEDYFDVRDFQKVAPKAQEIIKIAEDLNTAEQQKILIAQNLGESYLYYESELPLIEDGYLKTDEDFKVAKNRVETTRKEQNRAENGLNKRLIICESNLGKAKENQIKWNNIKVSDSNLIGIDSILKKVSEEESLKNRQSAKESELKTLNAQFDSITQKYAVQYKELENGKINEITTQKSNFLTFKNQISEQKTKVNQQYFDKIEQANEVFEKNTKSYQFQKDELQNTLKPLIAKRASITAKEYFKAEIEGKKEEIQKISAKTQTNEIEIGGKQKEIKSIRKEAESEEKLLKQTFEVKKKEFKTAIKQIEVEETGIKKNLASFENSFYKFLNDKYEGWEEKFAKVCSEEILFNTELSPKLQSISHLLYGVELDLSEIESNVKSVAEYEGDLDRLSNELEKNKVDLRQCLKQYDLDKIKVTKKTNRKISDLKKEVKKMEEEDSVNKLKLEKIELEKSDFEKKAKEEKVKELAKLNPKIVDTEKKNEDLTGEIKVQSQIKERSKKRAEVEKKEQLKVLNEKLNKEDTRVKKQIKTIEFECGEKYEGLRKGELEELAGKGADTNKIKEVDGELQKLEKDLGEIEDLNRKYVDRYKVEKLEIDKIPTLESSLQKLQKQLSILKEQNKITINELIENRDSIKEKLAELKRQKKEIEVDIEEYETFKKSSIYTELEYYITHIEQSKKHDSLAKLITSITRIFIEINKLNTQLSTKSKNFVSPLRENNIFSFPKEFKDERACLTFAQDLKEYIEEEKIEDVKLLVKKKHAGLINLIANNINLLVSKRKDIDKVISDINRDFAKSNFVNVIQAFEMKTEDTSNKIVQVLLKIKEFHDEHTFDLVPLNLFSQQNRENTKDESISLLTTLLKNLNENKRQTEINLEDIFELKFRAKQNNKDTGWKEKLSDVGSHGTDILLKAMIYIMLLNVFKEKASKKSKFKDFKLHCIMDEIGRIHSKNIKSLIKFANSRGIWMIFGSPEENNALAYKYIYDFEKHNGITAATRLIYDRSK